MAYIVKHLGQTTLGEEDCTYNGFGDLDDEESEDVEDDHAE